jgi:hypothetical protein
VAEKAIITEIFNLTYILFLRSRNILKKSLILTKQVLDEAEKSNDEDKSTEYNIEMVRLYSYTGNYDSAFFFINKTFTKLQNSVKLKNSVYHTIFLKEAINTTLKSKKLQFSRFSDTGIGKNLSKKRLLIPQ